MVHARRNEQWTHTALIASLLYNAWRGPHTKALSWQSFHPYLAPAQTRPGVKPDAVPAPIEALKVFLCPPHQANRKGS